MSLSLYILDCFFERHYNLLQKGVILGTVTLSCAQTKVLRKSQFFLEGGNAYKLSAMSSISRSVFSQPIQGSVMDFP